MKTIEDIISSINNAEFDSTGEPLYSYDQMELAMKSCIELAVKESLNVASDLATLYVDGSCDKISCKNNILSLETKILDWLKQK